MKKLMTLIGAVATAFGLFAANPVVTGYATFENEAGVQGDGTYVPSEAGWTWAGDPLTLGAYGDDDVAYVYPGNGNTRRTDVDSFSSQTKYLKLETTKNELLAFPKITGQSIFVDQLVQFTGFEEAPNFADDNNTKIAVWMEEAVVQEEDTTADPQVPEITATNLWITAGAAKTAIQIGETNEYKIGKWYRLTIKKVASDILADNAGDPLAGFIVYIDGVQVKTAEAQTLIGRSAVADAYKSIYDDNALFPAMNAGAITTVGYNGIGAIDDLVIDDQGPEFARFVDVTAEQLAITGAKVVKIDGVDVDAAGPWSVKPGSIVVTYAADGAFVVKGTPTATWSVSSSDVTMTKQDFTAEAAAAQVVNVATPTVTNYYVEADLYASIGAVVNGDTVTFLANCSIKDGNETTLYTFQEKTTIEVLAGGVWNVNVPKKGKKGGEITDNVGAMPGKNITVTFLESAGTLKIQGAIYGNDDAATTIFADNGAVTLVGNLAIGGAFDAVGNEAGAVLKANSINADTFKITLVGAGKVMSKTQLAYTGVDSVFANEEEIEEIAPAEDGGYYTYQIKAEEPKTGFAIIIADGSDTNYYPTFDAAWAAAQANDEIVLFADGTLGDLAKWTTSSAKIELNKDLTLTLNGHELTVGGYYGRLYVVSDATLTVDGSVAGSKLIGTLYAGIRLSAGHYSEGNIVINGGTYVAGDDDTYGLAAIQSNGGCENSSITATDATFVGGNMSVEPTAANRDAQGIAAVLAAKGTYTFTNCSFTGRTGIYAKAGTLTLDDCTVAANGTQFAPKANTDGSDPTGDAIIFDSNKSYKGDLKLNVKGNTTITSVNGYAFQETVTKGSASATLEIAVADTATVNGSVVLSDKFAEKVAAGQASISGYVATANNIAYPTLAAAVAADGDVTLLANVTLTETLTIAKANAINLAGKTITFGDGLKNGIVTTEAAQNLVISNGTFAVAGTRPAKGYAFQLYRVNALIKDVTMDTTGFEYGLEAETMLDEPDDWTQELVYTITCENVDVTGNGSLFHFENVRASLDADCTATAAGTSFGGAHEAAIYSSCGSIVTVNGGTYTAPNALQTGNLGGDIVVVDGEFNGNIKSYMYKGDDRWTENEASIEIVGGTFNGQFAYGTGPKGEACTKDEVTWAITGGSFAADPTEYLNAGYATVKKDNLWKVGQAIIATFKVGDEIFAAETNIVKFTPATPDPAPTAEGKTFKGWDPAIAEITESKEYTAQFDTLIDVPTAATGLAYTGAKQTGVAAGTGYTLEDDFEATDAGNYTATAKLADGYAWKNATGDQEIKWSIAKVELTATAADAEVTEGDPAPTYTVTVTGFVNGETAAGAAGYVAPTATSEYDPTTSKAGTPLAITVSGGSAKNYTFAYVHGTLTVNAKAPVIPVDDDKNLDDNGKAAAAKTLEVFGGAAAVTAWANAVYTDGKIPAAKLNKTTEDLIKIAKEYELPIMVAPTVAITQAAEGTGFEFQIIDEKVPVALQAAKVLSMVEFTTAIGDATKPFAAATTDNVTVAIKADSKTATADFTKATAAGFMRVNLKVPTVE